jgi:hypothetical protein
MRPARWILGTAGVALMGYAVAGALVTPGIVPTRHVAYLLTVLALHDGLLMPAFLAAGAAVHRLVPATVRPTVQAALVVTAATTLVALPLALGYGRIPDNPSALPRDYRTGLLLVLALVWLGAAATAVVRLARWRRFGAGRHGGPVTTPRRGHQ